MYSSIEEKSFLNVDLFHVEMWEFVVSLNFYKVSEGSE